VRLPTYVHTYGITDGTKICGLLCVTLCNAYTVGAKFASQQNERKKDKLAKVHSLSETVVL
jgi:hypothetical protein